ncbi:hypothetical protein H4W34_003333 [Actinomadura algeriensis]|uniref:Uncharacterized protein n=1 Tax=Actinomadura algeriensis TaxID=1679523 RepID=A0ABR9JSF3_9ACTN|nr:hypothetical protein [Actinomadura algeriensis]
MPDASPRLSTSRAAARKADSDPPPHRASAQAPHRFP